MRLFRCGLAGKITNICRPYFVISLYFHYSIHLHLLFIYLPGFYSFLIFVFTSQSNAFLCSSLSVLLSVFATAVAIEPDTLPRLVEGT
jgi:hypothetical protein